MKMIKNEEIIAKYPEAKAITVLYRSKVMTKKEWALDWAIDLVLFLFTVGPGIVGLADTLSDFGRYVLVEKKEGKALLVRFCGDDVEEHDVTGRVPGKGWQIAIMILRKRVSFLKWMCRKSQLIIQLTQSSLAG